MAESIVAGDFVVSRPVTWDHSRLLKTLYPTVLESMNKAIEHNEMEMALHSSGSSWSASQAHGLLCSRLAVLGEDGGADWLGQVLQDFDSGSVAHGDGVELMEGVFTETYRQLAAQQSEFMLLLPDDSGSAAVVTLALAEWCEGFLHGLVSDVQGDALKHKLAVEPLSEIIKDMLEITRASADDDGDAEANEEALTELIEYLRVAVQIVYEELGEHRRPAGETPSSLLPSGSIH